ncbi:MAG: SCO family protein [Acidimicrobiales bacterium]
MASRPDRRAVAVAATLVAALLAAVLGLASCGSGGSSGSSASDGGTTKGTQIEGLTRADPLDVGSATLPEVRADGSSTPFTFRASPGKLLFVAFGYTNCPDVCPTTLYDVKKARKLLGTDGKDVEVSFATVDPARDTPEKLTMYLHTFAKDGHALRPSTDAQLKAAEAPFNVTSTVQTNAKGEVEVAHTAKSFVVDDQGKVLVEWAFGTGPDAMANDLRILLDRIGTQK